MTGIVSGVISGVLVSVVGLLISYLARSRFELRYASPDAVTLRHNRAWPVVIGGSWEYGHGSNLFCTPDARAAVDGFAVGGFSETNLRNAGIPRPIGAAVDVSYRMAPLFLSRRAKKRQEVQTWRQEPSELHGLSRSERNGWRVETVTLRHG